MTDATKDLRTVLNPLAHPVCLIEPRYLPYSEWLQHIPFAMYLVDVLRPRTLLELGAHHGASYCAFCQAVLELRLDTRCFAVDTWQGDPHAGHYGAEVLLNLRSHHDALYGSFSRLIQSTFDEAVGHFAEGSIDLLHIDGYHTYEAVKHDYTAWLPKMSNRGVMLFHDINARQLDFGVWRFWEEVRDQYPSFEMLHCHGLGVLAVGAELVSEEFRALVGVNGEQATVVRELFFTLGCSIDVRTRQMPALYTQLSELESLSRKRGQHLLWVEGKLAEAEARVQVQEAEMFQLRARLAGVEDRARQQCAELGRLRDEVQLAHELVCGCGSEFSRLATAVVAKQGGTITEATRLLEKYVDRFRELKAVVAHAENALAQVGLEATDACRAA